MRFYKRQHAFYCGVDLHAKTMYLCIVNQSVEVLVHRNLPTRRPRRNQTTASAMPGTIIPKLERIGVEGSMTALPDDAFGTIPASTAPSSRATPQARCDTDTKHQ